MKETELDYNKTIPKEIELIPSEEIFTGFDGRVFKAIDKQAIISKTNSKLKYVVIDENHKIDYTAGTGQSTEAMGWMHDFFVKEDNSVWALVEWTESGSAKIKSKEYKYISPVYEVDKNGNIISILRAAITNNPNLRLTALNNKQNEFAERQLLGENSNKGDNMSKEINNALGINESASDSEVLNAINKTKNELESLKLELNNERENKKSLIEKNTNLEKALNEVNKEFAELKKVNIEKDAQAAVEKAINDGKIAPSTKDVYLSLCMEDEGIEKFNKIMENTPKARLFEETNIPNKTDNVSLNEADEEVARAMGYTKEEMLAMKEKESRASPTGAQTCE
ncbi:phage protease [Brachyspira pulli]|uniref:phage protease n=1 Tax=Brachyspira pulli TaxID=310721 RepID=UPI003005BA12